MYQHPICSFSDTDDALVVLDQTLLPNEERYIALRDAEAVAEAIKKLRVRGAPLIGIAAAMGLYVSVKNDVAKGADFRESFCRCRQVIGSSRPTAVNLSWALTRMERQLNQHPNLTVEESLRLMSSESLAIQRQEEETCTAIGRYGSQLITDGMGILTHCNAGELATGHYGTALAPIYSAHEQGKNIHVYSDETRPLLQGARLTAYELTRHGIPTTLICDNMAATVMSQGRVQMVLVGCDRVAANGDTANKIGTHGVAILAKHFGIPFYVCGPRSTFDPHCATGRDIVIEERDPEEVRSAWYARPMAPKECKTFNPAFDVTPHELITGYITEEGISSN